MRKGNMKQIQLSDDFFVLVDDEDYERISSWSWYLLKVKNSNNHYAVRHTPRPNRRHIYMHREILNAPDGVEVDHVDGNGLNNTRKNLRLCTRSQNMMNRRASSSNISGFKGVSWDKSRNNYLSKIKVKGKTINLGRFVDPIDAATAYDRAAVKYFGSYAKTNF